MREGRLAISLGTSDTVCGLMRELRIHDAGIGYVSASPTGDYMGTTVFKNGSLARERDPRRVRTGLGRLLCRAGARSRPGNHGALMLPWFDPEITPHVATPGVRRVRSRSRRRCGQRSRDRRGPDDGDGESHATGWAATPAVIYATGGAAGNRDGAAGDGGRLRRRSGPIARRAMPRRSAPRFAPGTRTGSRQGSRIEWDDVVAGFTDPDPAWRIRPRLDAVAV